MNRIRTNNQLLNVFRLPSLWILLILISSIIFSNYLTSYIIINIHLILILFAFSFIIFIILYKFKKYQISLIIVFILLFLSFMIFLIPLLSNSRQHIKNYLQFKDRLEIIEYEIMSYPSLKNIGGNIIYIYEAKAIKIIHNEVSVSVNGKVNIQYIGEDLNLTKGDIVISNKFPDYNPKKFYNKGKIELFNIFMNLDLNQDEIISTKYRSCIIDRFILDVRRNMTNYLDEYLSKNMTSIAKAVTIGDRSNLDGKTKELFSKTSSSHLLAISGLHAALVIILFSIILKKIIINRKLRFFVMFPFLIFIVLITGSRISIIRAVLIVILGLMASVFLERRKNYFNIFFLSALLILVFQPWMLFDISFQLSFTSVFAIFYFFIPIKNLLESKKDINRNTVGYRLIKYILYPPLIALFVHFTTYPIIIYHINSINLLGFISNLLAILLFAVFLYILVIFFIISFLPAFLLSNFSIVIEYLGRLLILFLYFVERLTLEVSIKPDYKYITIIIWLICFILMVWLFLKYTIADNDRV